MELIHDIILTAEHFIADHFAIDGNTFSCFRNIIEGINNIHLIDAFGDAIVDDGLNSLIVVASISQHFDAVGNSTVTRDDISSEQEDVIHASNAITGRGNVTVPKNSRLKTFVEVINQESFDESTSILSAIFKHGRDASNNISRSLILGRSECSFHVIDDGLKNTLVDGSDAVALDLSNEEEVANKMLREEILEIATNLINRSKRNIGLHLCSDDAAGIGLPSGGSSVSPSQQSNVLLSNFLRIFPIIFTFDNNFSLALNRLLLNSNLDGSGVVRCRLVGRRHLNRLLLNRIVLLIDLLLVGGLIVLLLNGSSLVHRLRLVATVNRLLVTISLLRLGCHLLHVGVVAVDDVPLKADTEIRIIDRRVSDRHTDVLEDVVRGVETALRRTLHEPLRPVERVRVFTGEVQVIHGLGFEAAGLGVVPGPRAGVPGHRRPPSPRTLSSRRCAAGGAPAHGRRELRRF